MKYSMVPAVLLGIACVLAKVEGHVTISLIACNTTAAEAETQLDDDEIFYVDFDLQKVVFTLPVFVDPMTAPGAYLQAREERLTCLHNLNVSIQAEHSPPEEIDPPQSTVYSMDEIELGKSNILVCFVNNFYPPPVTVKWSKNNVKTTKGVTSSRYYPNSDSTFQQFSTLSITPEEGDIYSCSVEHKGLREPQIRFWEPEANKESDMAETAFCGIGLTLGLLGVGVGTFFLIKGNNCN